MIKKILLTLAIILLPIVGSAQAIPTSKFDFDQIAPTLAEAQAYTPKYYPDGATTGIASTITCTGATSPYTCSIPVPAFTPGAHTVQLTVSNAAGESPKSAIFNFTFVVIPSAPANLRIR